MTALYKLFRKIFKDSLLENRVGRVILYALGLNIIFGSLFYLAERGVQENLTYFDSIWWAMVTMTTVGYGDFFAQTHLGRFIISYPCMLLGIGIIGYLVGVVAEQMIDRISKRKRGLMDVKLSNHIIICNYPSSDKIIRLIEELKRSHYYGQSPIVLVNDAIEELPDNLSKLKVHFVMGDPVREEILNKANIQQCAGVFILAEHSDKSASDSKTFAIGTQIEMIERETGKAIRTVVELVNKDNLKMLQRSKVDGIVSSDGILDGLMVQEFLYPGVHDIIHQIITNAVGSQFYIFDTKLEGYHISDIQMAVLKHPTNLQVIGICKNGQSHLNPSKTEKIGSGDQLIMLAENRRDFHAIEEEILSQKKLNKL
jgi:voltage-gated potassium channel